jgi:GNAT superfamily N-acetyltransferase
MAFEVVYHPNLRLSLEVKQALLAQCGGVWLYDAASRELIGETYGCALPEHLPLIEGPGIEDVSRFRNQPAVYVLSTTILPAFQGQGLGRVLKAFFLGLVSQAGYTLVLGHAREGRSARLNRAFGAQMRRAQPDWAGTGETYYFYTLELDAGRGGR